MEIIYFHIRNGNDAAADAAVGNLLTVFSGQPTFSKEIYQVADAYRNAGRYDKASQVTGASLNNLEASLNNSEAALNNLIADFNDHPALPSVIFRTAEQVAEQYYSKARAERSEGHDEQAKVYYQKFIALWEKIITELPPSAEYTPQAYYCMAGCYSQELGEDDKAIEYYQKLLKNWPDFDYRRSSYAWFGIACCYEKLEKAGRIPTSEAAGQICHACKKLLTNYPDTNPYMIQTARKLLERYQVGEQ